MSDEEPLDDSSGKKPKKKKFDINDLPDHLPDDFKAIIKTLSEFNQINDIDEESSDDGISAIIRISFLDLDQVDEILFEELRALILTEQTPLAEQLQMAIEDENYEEAARIRDEIKENLKNNESSESTDNKEIGEEEE